MVVQCNFWISTKSLIDINDQFWRYTQMQNPLFKWLGSPLTCSVGEIGNSFIKHWTPQQIFKWNLIIVDSSWRCGQSSYSLWSYIALKDWLNNVQQIKIQNPKCLMSYVQYGHMFPCTMKFCLLLSTECQQCKNKYIQQKLWLVPFWEEMYYPGFCSSWSDTTETLEDKTPTPLWRVDQNNGTMCSC